VFELVLRWGLHSMDEYENEIHSVTLSTPVQVSVVEFDENP
jgi:hypothetical protein